MKKLKFKKNSDINTIYYNFIESIKAKKLFIENKYEIKNLLNIAKKIKIKLSKGGKIYFAGNGGSASDSIHISTELISKLSKNRAPIPSGDLVSNISLISAISNDFSYKNIFTRQIEANLTNKDIFFAITTSGNSNNIVEALKLCKKKNIYSILLTGKSGGISKKHANNFICVPSNRTQTIQEVHILIGHCLCEILENSLYE
tara:strand:- start:205 stop:810 length:606 start_codon:yes stop_codon:yes gene_type:complete